MEKKCPNDQILSSYGLKDSNHVFRTANKWIQVPVSYLRHGMRALLITPPFTQLNTPYPGTAYLKGFLNTLDHPSRQADLGIEVILRVFSSEGLKQVFQKVESSDGELSENAFRICMLRDRYLRTIDSVMSFLQHKDSTLAYAIVERGFLPEAKRFQNLEDLDWAFGTLGIQDHARHLATLYLEDLGDLITETVDPHFGFSRYAERLGRTASSFALLDEALQEPNSLISNEMIASLEAHLAAFSPELLCLSVPFPGNLFGAFKIAQHVKANYPQLPIVMGGGFANTELRSLADPRVFDYLDFVCLDDGEAPLKLLIEHLEGKRPLELLKRTFARQNDKVVYFNGAPEKDVAQRDVGTPDYGDLLLDKYLSVIEVANPMHRLWSDGRWNKLTLAHGCYWGKCAFCDISLDYIQRYEPITAGLICDRIEEIIAQTGQRGFHFVDEAAPPALMRDLAIELIRRGLVITWWTNIRFEKRFSPDMCRLLRASGCVAVSGGLEVASDRLLERMKKGVTVEQVARVADAFTQAGIMVHAYLMYGFPTQTAQETIDSLERVRQLFESGVLQSGFWHHFAMTAHSPVGLDPQAYGVKDLGPEFKGFADNDRFHDDPEGASHEDYSEGLRISLHNFMLGAGFDLPLSKWFNFRVPETTVPPDFIAKSLEEEPYDARTSLKSLVWLGAEPQLDDNEDGSGLLTIFENRAEQAFSLPWPQAEWLSQTLNSCIPRADAEMPVVADVASDFEGIGWGDWNHFWVSGLCLKIREMGWLMV